MASFKLPINESNYYPNRRWLLSRDPEARIKVALHGEDWRMEVPKFITIGYGDRAGYDRTPESVRNAAHAHDAELVRAGALMWVAGDPVQVRNPDDAGTSVIPGSYLTSELPIAGFGIIEAETLEDAVELASKSPCAVAHGVIEVWPLREMP